VESEFRIKIEKLTTQKQKFTTIISTHLEEIQSYQHQIETLNQSIRLQSQQIEIGISTLKEQNLIKQSKIEKLKNYIQQFKYVLHKDIFTNKMNISQFSLLPIHLDHISIDFLDNKLSRICLEIITHFEYVLFVLEYFYVHAISDQSKTLYL
jgi:hypothetical protein